MRDINYIFMEDKSIIPTHVFGTTDSGKVFVLKRDKNNHDPNFGFMEHTDNTHRISFNQWIKIFPESKDYFIAKKQEYNKEFERLNSEKKIDLIKNDASLVDKKYSNPIKEIKSKINFCQNIINDIESRDIFFKPGKDKASITKDIINRVKLIPIPSIINFNTAGYAKSVWNKNEKTPSMKYYKDKNRVYCFSSSKHGDVIDVVSAEHGLTFTDAVKFLMKYI